VSQHVHLDITGRVNASEGATIEVDRDREIMIVRPKAERRTYDLPLRTVAEMVVARVVKNELARGEKKR